MQDDEAFDRAIDAARYYGKPCYTQQVDGWMRDETGKFPPIPPQDGFTKASSKNCAHCGQSIASALDRPVCAQCEIILSGDQEKIAALAEAIRSGVRAQSAARMIVYGTDDFWDCVYGPRKVAVPREVMEQADRSLLLR